MLSALKHIKTIFPAGAGWVCFGWLFVLSGTLSAQHVFNQYFDWDGRVQSILSMYESESYYHCFINNSGPTLDDWKLRYLRLDQHGEKIYDRVIIQEERNTFRLSWGGLILLADTTPVVYGGFRNQDDQKLYGFIFECNGSGEIVADHRYEPQTEFLQIMDLKSYGQDGYIALANEYDGSSTLIKLMVLDSDFSVVYDTLYPGGPQQIGQSLEFLPDSSMVIVGVTDRSFVYDLIVMHIGRDFVNDWTRRIYSDGAWGAEVPGVAVLDNGDILAVTGLSKRNQNYYSKYAIRLRPDGTTVWERQYRQERNCAFRGNPIVQADGSIVIGGYRDFPREGASGTVRYSTFTKMDGNGELMWERLYYYEEMRNTRFIDVQQAQDGGFLGVGYVFPRETNSQDAWIVKTDGDGCLVAGCDSIGMISSADLVEVPLGRLLAGPNPVGEILYVQYDLYEPGGGYEISLLDSRGMELRRLPLAGYAPAGQIDWTMSGLPAGLYVLKLSYNGVPQGLVKLIKH